MKRLNLFYLLIFLLMNNNSISQVQKQIWYFSESEVDFRAAVPTISTGSGYGISDFPANGISDQDGELLLSVGRSSVKNKYGGGVGNLEHFQLHGGEPAHIIPVPGSSCQYYIIYTSFVAIADIPGPDDPPRYCDVYLEMPPGSNTGYFNTFYSKADMSAYHGDGIITDSGIPLEVCGDYQLGSQAVAVSPTVNAQGDRFMYLFGATFHLSIGEIKKYIITSTGITYVNTIYSNSLPLSHPDGFGTPELELSHDRSTLAVCSYGGNKVILYHLNAAGNIDPLAGANADGTSYFTIPTTSKVLTGLEFSPNGNYLYVNAKNEGIYQINIPLNSVSPLAIFGSDTYGFSELELAYEPTSDYKIYAVSDDGTKLGCVNSPNSGSPSFTTEVVTGITAYEQNWCSNFPNFTGSSVSNWALPNQIDGEDYLDHFEEVQAECCEALEGYNIVNYISTPNSSTWQPGTNPFGGLDLLRVAEEIRVPTGKTLHLKNMTIEFFDDAKLVVEVGAKLILTNTTLTSTECDGIMWQGVELHGDLYNDQIPYTNQGRIIMQSNSVISNAINGIKAYGMTITGGTNWAQTGGLIQASNSKFINNHRDVAFLSYPFKNHSKFTNCEFLTTAAIKNGATPYARISMYHVDGVAIRGCDFKNTTTGLYADDQRGIGIHTIDAKYSVSNACNVIMPFGVPCSEADMDRSTFEGLYTGIEAIGTNPLFTIDVRYNVFINNTKGAFIEGIDYAVFSENDLSVRNPSPFSYGLYLQNCDGYRVENNSFNSIYPTSTYGLVVNNSNDGGTTNSVNQIYHNNFDGFDYAASAVLSNVELSGGNPVNATGLTFKCNKFDNTSRYDILNAYGGISPFQGSCLMVDPGEAHAQANNQFSFDASIGDFWNGPLDPDFQVDYRHEDGYPTYNMEPRPTYIDGAVTTTSECGTFSPLTSCPTNQWDYGTIELRYGVEKYKLLSNNLVNQIDGGDTDDLIDDINTMVSEPALQTLLIDKSPYLSDLVLTAVLNKATPLHDSTVANVIIANSPVTDDIMDLIVSKGYPSAIMYQISLYQVGVSDMSNLKSKISTSIINADLFYNELCRRFIHDTTIVNGEDSLVSLLKEYKSKVDYQNLSYISIKNNDISEATSMIDSLRTFSGRDSLCDYLEILLDLESELGGIYHLKEDSLMKIEIQNIADRDDQSKEGAGARSILRTLDNLVYLELFPAVGPLAINIENEIDPLSSITPSLLINIFPNPAKNQFVINYIDYEEDEKSKAKFYLYDITGKLILENFINSKLTNINAENLSTGTYIIQVHHKNQIETHKLMINKL